ncbi:MAG: tetratricopeptide repeat protein [Gemmatimonadota bacterium]|nr:tetratricopeptide repeat protein [Gemmatimonadota bacterium]MDH5758309.1 tetratricopeptide repeat protein [Gemmatimonadota bacterium]
MQEARRLFAMEVARPEDEIDMARAALLVAGEEYPQLSVELYLARLDQIAEEVKDRLADETAPPVVLAEILDTLYQRRGFHGNREAFYDPRNSFLNDVLDRYTGIPLTLGMVLLEVGWRLGLPLEGVTFPAHFLVRYRGSALRLLIDPYDSGKMYLQDEAQALLDRTYGGMVRVQDAHMAVASRRYMLTRLLNNLKSVYTNVGDHARALAAVDRLLILAPRVPSDVRLRGMLLAHLGRYDEAATQLEQYLVLAPRSADAGRIRSMVADLKSGRPPEGGDLPGSEGRMG